jgi:hypothetical protein
LTNNIFGISPMTTAPQWRPLISRGCCHDDQICILFGQSRGPGEIPNVRAITSCQRRQKASLSDACRAVFEQ